MNNIEEVKETDFEIDYSEYRSSFEKIGSDAKNIVLISNFIDEDDLIKLKSYAESYQDSENFSGGKDLSLNFVKNDNNEIYLLMQKYQEKIWLKVKESYVDKYGVKILHNPQNPIHFIKWRKGMASALHSDCERPDGTPAFHANFYKLNISALMYLNSNYEGGRIQFPKYDVSIKPNPGDLIIFPSNGEYRHEVTEVKSGNRFTMPTWYTFDVPAQEMGGNFNYADSIILWKNKGEDLKGSHT
jgi:hypothetical protein